MLFDYNCQDGQTIYDVAIATYGDTSYTMKLISDNISVIPDLNTEIATGMIVQYERLAKPVIKRAKEFIAENPTQLSCLNSQSIFDVVIQLYGDLKFTYKLIQESGFLDIDTDISTGDIAIFEFQKTKFPTYFRNNVFTVSNWVSENIEAGEFELREDYTYELREDGGVELRQ